MEFLVLEILRLNIASQDSESDDDVSALSGSDSDVLETVVEKADLVEFSLIICWVWKRFIYMGNLQIASVFNFWRETAERNFGCFTMHNKVISPEISSLPDDHI